MTVLPSPPVIATIGPDGLALARVAAANLDPTSISRRESARSVGIDSLPFLTSTESGQRFLAAAFPRAIARGMPHESCPTIAMATAAPGGSRAEVAVQALRNCLAKLRPENADCGCRIVALDDLVTVPLDQTAYATGSSARLRVASLGVDLLLVSEETAVGDTLLRDLRGSVARLERGENDAVTVEFLANGRRFEGNRISVGFRRGRIAERIYAVDSEGNRLSLLIGFEPDELAARAGAWLAWPAEG